ncbi:uncharacterized protein LOC123465612 [Bubalus bubalis]|uniref:uncharacterized protein LOC123465612 n=1 Tax=Bubalus bubalis TaxID=89462 RepID=UPI00042D0C3C|nr:uncharacterized protein LOC102414775 [Bubalus bubalis]XP_045021101.1 uncharacterized protein LOC123465612 [Bubalus bubalis]
MHRYLRKVVRTKRMRKSKRKVKVKTRCPGILPTPFVPPQSEEEEVVNKKLTLLNAKEHYLDLPKEDGLQSWKDEGACVMHQECQIQPHELSVSPELGSSSPAVTSLASPPLCFSCFLSCFCQTFSRSRRRKSLGREGTMQAEAGGDAKALRPGLLRVLGKSKMQPH